MAPQIGAASTKRNIRSDMANNVNDRAAKIRVVLEQLRELIPEQGGTLEIYRDEKLPWRVSVVGDELAILRLGHALLNASVEENRFRGAAPNVSFSGWTEAVGILVDEPSQDPRPRAIDFIKQLNGTLILITVLHVLILILVISTLLVVSTGRTG
jgi:hypothetical protein